MKRALDFTEGSEELPPAKVLCQRDRDSMASSSSTSSISSTSQWKYDVFLNFRGEDTRNNIVDFLNYALQRGFYIFKDDERLEGGKTIKPELLKAIEKSRFAVVILSENYASSTWCLDELVKIVDCEKEMGMTILPIFYNVDPSDVRKLKGAFAKAFDEHEKQFKEKVGRWRDALNHVAGIVGYHVKNSLPSKAVEWIVGQLSHVLSFELSEITEDLVGMRSRLVELESCLALKDDVRFIGIWAMGGMGKSTLARVVYTRDFRKFDFSCFIENVREKDELSIQKELISQILHGTNLIKNKYDGAHMIKKILWNEKVLLVLDDVDELKKLKMLVSKSDRFGSGSRIIITTRDRHLLKKFPVDVTFEVKALNYEDSLRLFCSKAFKEEQCPCEYLELSKRFLEYVNGLPLALEVLGSFLFEKSTAEWESALDMLKENPEPEINKVLKISFFGLPDSVKDIFIDIACFFNHENEDHVVQMLYCIGRGYPKFGLTILIEKSLLKISENNVLWMHDLLRDMGRDIARQKYRDEPGKQSRLWFDKDIDHVLKNNKGTKKVQAMDIRGAEACRRGFTFSLWNPNAFSKMSNLKFLRVSNVFPQHVPEHLPNSLRYLEWSGYPAKSLPCFQPNELVQLHLQHSKIEFLWEGMMVFENLKSINMDGSSNLIEAPNFDGVQNLEKLVLSRCSSLCKLHPSIGKLKKLKLLNLEECQELTTLPDKFEMESLETLNLTHCLKVKKIPEFVGNMELLQELRLEGTAITELPSSIECLTGLNTLILQNCKNLVCLPNNICSLTSLIDLNLSGCSKFDKLPEDLGNIVSLENLNLSGTAIKELPSSIEFLIGLESLALEDCKEFEVLPSTVCSLKSLKRMYLSGCPKFVDLPENFGNLKHLGWLSLEGTAIEVLPSSVGHLAVLEYLYLKDCKNLVCLPSTISNLKRLRDLRLTGCSKITNLPENLGNMERLRDLYLDGTAIKELYLPPPSTLPESISQFSELRHLYLGGCKSLRSLLNIPSKVWTICVDNCTSLERLPKPPTDHNFQVECFNCFKLAYNIQNFSNMFQGQSSQQFEICYIIPGREIPKWFEKVNICDTSVGPNYKTKKVKIQLPGSGSGCDEWRGIVLCVLFLPTDLPHRFSRCRYIGVNGLQGYLRFLSEFNIRSEYGKVESQHLWLHSVSKNNFRLPKTPGCSIDKKGFHQVELEIETWGGLEVEEIGFRVV